MEILILLLAAVSIVICMEIRHTGKQLPPEEETDKLTFETASVTADFLEAGQVVSILSGGNYLGTISVRPQYRKHNQVGYVVTMYDSGNLRCAYAAYQEEHPEIFQQKGETFHILERFLDTYGGCYDSERNALVYQTKHSAGTEGIREGERELRDRIALHPLAEMESLSEIHTKYVGKL